MMHKFDMDVDIILISNQTVHYKITILFFITLIIYYMYPSVISQKSQSITPCYMLIGIILHAKERLFSPSNPGYRVLMLHALITINFMMVS